MKKTHPKTQSVYVPKRKVKNFNQWHQGYINAKLREIRLGI